METGTKKRKSIALTKDEWKALKNCLSGFNTVVECAESIGIHRNVLDRVLVFGSGSFETINKIRAAISVDTDKATHQIS